VPCPSFFLRHVEIACKDLEILKHGQLGIQAVLLLANPMRALILRQSVEMSRPKTSRRPRVMGENRRASGWLSSCRRHSGREFRTLPGGHVKRDVVDGDEITEFLHDMTGRDDERGG